MPDVSFLVELVRHGIVRCPRPVVDAAVVGTRGEFACRARSDAGGCRATPRPRHLSIRPYDLGIGFPDWSTKPDSQLLARLQAKIDRPHPLFDVGLGQGRASSPGQSTVIVSFPAASGGRW